MKIGVTQTRPIKGDICANIKKHIELAELACSLNANVLFFPELSLTCYEPCLAKELAIFLDDVRLDVFQKISNNNNITIGLGAPTKSDTGIHISMIIFQPHQRRKIYSKQQLHADEFPYFKAGNNQVILIVENQKIAPAICYESLQENHSVHSKKLGAEIYISSVAKSQN